MPSLLLFLALVAAAAVTGSRFSPGEWYESIVKAPWTPPSWLFGPVWTVLYLGIAVAGWRVWRNTSRRPSPALVWWGVQLVLNTAWSWFFFGLHRPDLALVDIALLLGTIVAFALTAWPVDRLATWLFVPYGLWVAYATTLTFYVWRFNPG